MTSPGKLRKEGKKLMSRHGMEVSDILLLDIGDLPLFVTAVLAEVSTSPGCHNARLPFGNYTREPLRNLVPS